VAYPGDAAPRIQPIAPTLRKGASDGAVAHFQSMMMDVDQVAKAMKDAEIEAEIEDFLEGFKQPTYRGMRVVRIRVATWGRARSAGAGCRGPRGGLDGVPEALSRLKSGKCTGFQNERRPASFLDV
jgi:hypothetical protein